MTRGSRPWKVPFKKRGERNHCGSEKEGYIPSLSSSRPDAHRHKIVDSIRSISGKRIRMSRIASSYGTVFRMSLSLTPLLDTLNNVLFIYDPQDQAHLPNERISLQNLNKGRAVTERFFQKAADIQFQQFLKPVN